MRDQLESESPPAVASLVSGIVSDAQDLISQQLRLFQVEVKNDLRRTKEAAVPVAIGATLVHLGAIALILSIGYLLHWVWPALPLWGALAIVASSLILVGLAVTLWGKSKFDSFNPLPDKTVAGLQENIQWKTKT